jgi:hypothetical protein
MRHATVWLNAILSMGLIRARSTVAEAEGKERREILTLALGLTVGHRAPQRNALRCGWFAQPVPSGPALGGDNHGRPASGRRNLVALGLLAPKIVEAICEGNNQ